MNAAKTTIVVFITISALSGCEKVDGMGYAERAGHNLDMSAHNAMKKIDKIGGAIDKFGPTRSAQAAEIVQVADADAEVDDDGDDDDSPTTTATRIGRELDNMAGEITLLASSASGQLEGAIRNLQDIKNK